MDDRERIDQEPDVDVQCASRYPGEERLFDGALVGVLRQEVEPHADRHGEGGGRHQEGEPTGGRLAEAATGDDQHDEAEEG